MTTQTLPLMSETERAECGLITLCCDQCRDETGLPPVEPERIADTTWYYCGRCGYQWIATDRIHRFGLTSVAGLIDAVINIAWVIFMLGSLIGVIALVGGDYITRYPHGTDDPRLLGTMAVGVLSWLAMVTVVSRIVAALDLAVRLAVCSVWGRPLWDYES